MSTTLADSSAASRPTPSLRALLALAWPIVVSRSSQTVMGVSDAIMVAHLGQEALAATTTGAFNTFLVLIFPMGTMFIVSSFSAQLFGKGDVAGARRYGFYGLILAAVTQALCMGGIVATPWLLSHLDYDPKVRELMIGYLSVRLLSGGAAMGLEALSNYYGGIGNTRLPMVANVIAMALTLVGNYLFIDGHLGAPTLGVKGSALANLLSTLVGFLWLLGKFILDGKRLGVVVPKLSTRELWRMLRFGLPAGFNWFFEFFAFNFFVNVVVAGLGTSALAGMMSVLQINSVSFMPAFGLASAGAILVGQAIGAGHKDDVPRVMKLTFFTAGTWQALVGLSYLVMPAVLFAPFAQGPDAKALMQVGVRMLMLSAAWQLFDAAVNTVAEALRAAGDTAFTMWARTVLGWLFFAPGSYVSVRVLGGNDVTAMAWVVTYMGLLAGVLYWRFRTGAWRRVELTESPELMTA